jgi:hypothetical protein
MEEGARTKTKLVLSILIVSVLIVIAIYISYQWSINGKNPVEAISEGIDTIFNPGENGNAPEEEIPIIIGGGGGGGSEGGSGGGGGSGDLNCFTQSVAYSLINVNKTSTCNLEQDGFCVDKTVSCSVQVHNDDNGVTGTFSVELYFVEQGKPKNQSIDYELRELTISPNQFQLFEDSTNVQSTGENGTANQEINCIFQTTEVPTKEVCN